MTYRSEQSGSDPVSRMRQIIYLPAMLLITACGNLISTETATEPVDVSVAGSPVAVFDGGVVLLHEDTLEQQKLHFESERRALNLGREKSRRKPGKWTRTWTNWTVRADLPTPPEPRTTILYSLILV